MLLLEGTSYRRVLRVALAGVGPRHRKGPLITIVFRAVGEPGEQTAVHLISAEVDEESAGRVMADQGGIEITP